MAGDLPIGTGPNNVGDVAALQVVELEGLGEIGANDSDATAQPIPLGTLPGQNQAVDILGNLSFRANSGSPAFTTDIDTYQVELRQGDILDISVSGSGGSIDVLYGDGSFWFATDTNQAAFYPTSSPLQVEGNVVAAQVVPEDGTYFIQTSTQNLNSAYTMGLRVYRPAAESLPIGQSQKIFLDFRAQSLTANDFPDSDLDAFPGRVRLRSFGDTLADLDPAFVNTTGGPNNTVIDGIINRTISEVERHFRQIAIEGNNGDFASTGIPGEFGVEIFNSRDHLEVKDDPNALRVTVAGTGADLPPIGRSQTIDIGNFERNERVYITLDSIYDETTIIPIASNESFGNAFATHLGSIISHEVGHAIGLRHTDPNNAVGSIIDQGGTLIRTLQSFGVGVDGIFGTADDVPATFRDDEFNNEGLFGTSRVVAAIANTLVSGTAGTSVSGRVFEDSNGDGSGTGDQGISGVTVFADVDGNGVYTSPEPISVTDAAGNYSLAVAPGSSPSIQVLPLEGFAATTSTAVTVAAGSAGPSFGFRQINPDVTGTTFIDTNGNGVRDDGDAGIPNIYIYADLDGDNRPDLGEPSVRSGPNGEYVLDLNTPGTFAIRQVLPPGFEQTFPETGEHTVTFDGLSLNGTFDFGLLPSQDFGDAPDTYGTTNSANGPSHGVNPSLRLGSLIDREADGQPSVNADGDGADEDGVRVLSPLAPGSAGVIEVDVLNNTGADAYLQAFIDFGNDGDFNDASDVAITNLLVPSDGALQTLSLSVDVPAGAQIGSTYARFRLAPAPNIGPLGFAAGGEVEDYRFDVTQTAELANDDSFNDNDAFRVDRNSLSNPLPVLANDFVTATNDLAIVQLQTLNVEPGLNTQGTVTISNDGQQVFYTPPNGFVGRDVFLYTVQDAFGNFATATVEVSVAFQTSIPIAVDDIFPVTPGTSSRSLNVLDNDIESTIGGLRVTSVGSGDQGGTVAIIGGGQSVRYTPQPGFAGTEQFFYSIQDAAGSISTATVTVFVSPGSETDDQVVYSIELLDPTNTDSPVTNVEVGDEVLVRVSVEDISALGNDPGVAAGFIDLLYSSRLVSTLPGNGNGFPFDITYGPLFDAAGNLLTGDDSVPGLIDDVGGVQNINNIQEFTGPTELFTIRVRADAPGVAVFAADPADLDESETILVENDTVVPLQRQGFGFTELTIFPNGDEFSSAIDDSFPSGVDSIGQPVTSDLSQPAARLNVLENDNLGLTGNIIDRVIINSPTLGEATFVDNGTDTLNDDYIVYRPDPLSRGLESFRYLITTEDGVQSTANVTLAIGSPDFDVEYTFQLVDEAGNAIDSVAVGERFGVRMIAEQFINNQYVYAAFQDVLYTSGLISPSTTLVGSDGFEFDFDVEIAAPFEEQAGTGTAARPGIIDEFGSFDEAQIDGNIDNPTVVATLFFEADAVGTVSIVGSPADSFPEHQTLVLDVDDPIDPERIKYNQFQFQVTPGQTVSATQNPNLAPDVNNDGSVSPLDALLIINDLRRGQNSASGESASSASVLYTDVSGDSKTTPFDALMVVNYIRRTRNSAVGEEAVQSSSGELIAQSTSVAVFTPVAEVNTDSVFASLDSVDPLVDTSLPESDSPGTSSALLDAIAAASEDDDDEVYDMLANDQIQA